VLLLLITGAKLEMCTHPTMCNIPGLYEPFLENLLEINLKTAAGLGIGTLMLSGSNRRGEGSSARLM